MGLPLQNGAPQITVGGRTYGVGVFLWLQADGADYTVGVFELKADGWNFVMPGNVIARYLNPGEILADIKLKGGAMAYVNWIKTQANTAFAVMFGAAPAATAPVEFKNDDEALAWIAGQVNSMKLTLVNGVPVLG
jgi:hypothetical protein